MLTRLLIVRPSVRVHAKKNNFVEPAEAPGEGNRRPPNEKENLDSALATRDDIGGRERKPKEVEKPHPLKKFLMDVFKIKEIDYEKFNKENKWAIRPNNDKE
tara:strand:+ start:572 stop:877 length:306 start_codon:yes stop_codon:yes gene_type:complete